VGKAEYGAAISARHGFHANYKRVSVSRHCALRIEHLAFALHRPQRRAFMFNQKRIASARRQSRLTVTMAFFIASVPIAATAGAPGCTGATNHDDVIVCSRFDDRVHALAGADRVRGDEGEDEVRGGTGADDLRGNEGFDRLFGGDGHDGILGGGGHDRLFGHEGADHISGAEGADVVVGGTGADELRGNSDADYLEGSSGNDWILPGKGGDMVEAGPGDDVIDLRDGQRDESACGSGRDLVFIDEKDHVSAACERVERVKA
jgi:Ca2+-binding RTX toxin-like protein